MAARVVFDLNQRDHITCALRELHWLPISERVLYKLFSRPQVITRTITRLHHGLAAASRCHFIPVLTAGRQSRRLCRPTDEPENGRSSIFHRCTERMEPAADLTEKNIIDICLSPRTENAPFQPCILLRITHDNDYVMCPWSYSRGLRNKKKLMLMLMLMLMTSRGLFATAELLLHRICAIG